MVNSNTNLNRIEGVLFSSLLLVVVILIVKWCVRMYSGLLTRIISMGRMFKVFFQGTHFRFLKNLIFSCCVTEFMSVGQIKRVLRSFWAKEQRPLKVVPLGVFDVGLFIGLCISEMPV